MFIGSRRAARQPIKGGLIFGNVGGSDRGRKSGREIFLCLHGFRSGGVAILRVVLR